MNSSIGWAFHCIGLAVMYEDECKPERVNFDKWFDGLLNWSYERTMKLTNGKAYQIWGK
jgi:hypothetical protein